MGGYKNISVNCVNCETEFMVNKSRYNMSVKIKSRLFCSNKCVGEFNRGSRSPVYNSIECVCDECGEKFMKKKSHVYSHNFCSKDCFIKYQKRTALNDKGLSDWKVKIRAQEIYREWRFSIYKRDEFTCKKCGTTRKKLNAHHIIGLDWILKQENITDLEEAMNYSFLYDTDNGVTLCEDCHKEFHSIYGKRKFTPENYYNWIIQ